MAKSIKVTKVVEALRDAYLDVVLVEGDRIDPPAVGGHRARHLSPPECSDVDHLRSQLEEGMDMGEEVEILKQLHIIYARHLGGSYGPGLQYADKIKRQRTLAVIQALEGLLEGEN